MLGDVLGLSDQLPQSARYEDRLFDTSKVHTIDIAIDNWDAFLETWDDKEYAVCSLTIDGKSFPNVAIRIKGISSIQAVVGRGSQRFSFKVEFDHYNDGSSYYGLDKLCLNNNIQDNTCMKDYLSYQLMTSAGVHTPLFSYTFLTVNGADWGLYLAVEGIEDAFLSRNYGSDYGNLYKPDLVDESSDDQGVKLQYTGDDPDRYASIIDTAKTKISTSDEKRLVEALKILSKQETPERAVDVEQVIRYFAVHNFVVNGDSYTGNMIHNYYLYEKDGILSMIPWDYNLAFGGSGEFNGVPLEGSDWKLYRDATPAVNDPIDTVLEDRPMQSWIFSSQKYTDLYHQYYLELLTSCRLTEEIEKIRLLIAPYVERDPTKFCSYEEFQSSVDLLKDFCTLRTLSVQGQLAGTIPATRETQAANPASLLDASMLNLSDMGDMWS